MLATPQRPWFYARDLVEGVGSGAPPGEEHAQADCLEDTAENTDSDNVHGTSLGSNLSDELQRVRTVSINKGAVTYTWASGSAEDQRAEVGGTFVAQGAGGIEERGNTVGLETRSNDGRAPACSSSSCLAGLEEFLLAVSSLSSVVGVTKQRCENGSG